MSTHTVLFLFACLLLLLGVWLYQYSRRFRSPSRAQEAQCAHVPRGLKPRSPLDCPACRLAASTVPEREPTRGPVRPWREVKSRQGAPRRINTEGVACPNRTCSYFRISDSQIHAVVSDGRHGKAERIQRWRCQSCQTCFSERLHTPPCIS